MSIADELRNLQELYQDGALSDEEFARAKERVLRPDESQGRHQVIQARNEVPAAQAGIPSKKNNPMALTGFILGLASVVFYAIGIVPILAVVFSTIGAFGFKDGEQKNAWMATVGFVLGLIYSFVMLAHYGQPR